MSLPRILPQKSVTKLGAKHFAPCTTLSRELLYFCFLFADWVEKEARILFFHLRKESDGSSKRRLFVA